MDRRILRISFAVLAAALACGNNGPRRAATNVHPDAERPVDAGVAGTGQPDGGLLADAGIGREPPDAGPVSSATFPFGIRSYVGAAWDDQQFDKLNELGVRLIHGPHVLWEMTQPRETSWKPEPAIAFAARARAKGIKIVPILIVPKLDHLHWDPNLGRESPEYLRHVKEFARRVTAQLRVAAAESWSGIVSVWAAGGDLLGFVGHKRPERVVPVQNAVYDGVKLADPNAVVAAFNFGTAIGLADFQRWYEEAFRLSPKFDWFGNTMMVGQSTSAGLDPHEGLAGQLWIRRFLDDHGFAGKPIFQHEAAVCWSQYGGDYERGIPDADSLAFQAEQTVQTWVVARALATTLKLGGWIHHTFFGKTSDEDENRCGLFEPTWGAVSSDAGALVARPAWDALKVLVNVVGFLDYDHDATLQGQMNEMAPFVYRFAHRTLPTKKLWVVFSPRSKIRAADVGPVTISIAPATTARALNIMGAAETLTVNAGTVTIPSSPSPTYILAP